MVREGEPVPAADAYVVRDAHRHAWMREASDRTGAVVIEVGLPVWRPEHARGYVATYGAGRASLAAAADILHPPVRILSSFLERELAEQPEALARLFDRQRDEATRIAALLTREDVQYILIASRGSSSNVARYAQYLLGRAHQVRFSSATPSLYTLYGQPPRLDGALVVGISQSGESPDVNAVIAEARAQGRPTVALTNVPSSPLGSSVDAVLALEAGVEQSVAATKDVRQLARRDRAPVRDVDR